MKTRAIVVVIAGRYFNAGYSTSMRSKSLLKLNSTHPLHCLWYFELGDTGKPFLSLRKVFDLLIQLSEFWIHIWNKWGYWEHLSFSTMKWILQVLYPNTAMRNKENSADKSKLKSCGLRSWKHRQRLAHHTCYTKMRATERVTNRWVEVFYHCHHCYSISLHQGLKKSVVQLFRKSRVSSWARNFSLSLALWVGPRQVCQLNKKKTVNIRLTRKAKFERYLSKGQAEISLFIRDLRKCLCKQTDLIHVC